MGRDLKTTSCTASLRPWTLDRCTLTFYNEELFCSNYHRVLVVAQGVYEREGGGVYDTLYPILLSQVTYIILSKEWVWLQHSK